MNLDREWFLPPASCPTCSAPTKREGAHLFCTGSACGATTAAQIKHWIKHLEVEYFGDSLIVPLVESGRVTTVADLYTLTVADLTAIDRIGQRTAERALANLADKRTVPLHLLLGSLGIPGFGRRLAQQVVDSGLDTLDKVLAATPEQLAAVEGFGTERVAQVLEGFRLKQDFIQKLSSHLTVVNPGQTAGKTGSNGGALAGVSICITGALSCSKSDYQKRIEAAGGTFESSVGKGLTYLVAEDPNSGSSKLQKATKLGVQVIDEAKLQELLG